MWKGKCVNFLNYASQKHLTNKCIFFDVLLCDLHFSVSKLSILLFCYTFKMKLL
jgi:hypothetical protein